MTIPDTGRAAPADPPTTGPPPTYVLAAETRAVEEGHLARVLADGSVLVKAESRPGSYLVRIRAVDAGVVKFSCTCASGWHRRALAVPCKHAALVGRRLEREGLARWRAGAWYLRGRAALRTALASIRSRPARARVPAGVQPPGGATGTAA
ncbi:MAG TPA: hypothetical protein VKG45_00710 [Actinomycetes bacterium]|nr:hypothetical protein [Actinomycetes bacterium]